MTTIKIFGREPVVITNTIEAVLACLIAFHALDFIGISGADTLAVVMTVVSSTLGVYVAYVTRETLLGALTGFIKAVLVLGAVYGFELTAEQTAGVLSAVTFVLALWHRTQTGPALIPSLHEPALAGPGPQEVIAQSLKTLAAQNEVLRDLEERVDRVRTKRDPSARRIK